MHTRSMTIRFKMWGGSFTDANEVGDTLPSVLLLARRELETKLENLGLLLHAVSLFRSDRDTSNTDDTIKHSINSCFTPKSKRRRGG